MALRVYEQTANKGAALVQHQPTQGHLQLFRILLYDFLLDHRDEETAKAAAGGWPPTGRNRSYSFPDFRYLFHQAQLHEHVARAFPSQIIITRFILNFFIKPSLILDMWS